MRDVANVCPRNLTSRGYTSNITRMNVGHVMHFYIRRINVGHVTHFSIRPGQVTSRHYEDKRWSRHAFFCHVTSRHVITRINVGHITHFSVTSRHVTPSRSFWYLRYDYEDKRWSRHAFFCHVTSRHVTLPRSCWYLIESP